MKAGLSEHEAVKMARGASRRRWFGLRSAPAVAPVESDGVDVFACHPDDAGDLKLQRLDGEARRTSATAAPPAYVLVATARRPLRLVLANLLQDSSGHAWDLLLEGAVTIVNARRFLTRQALKLVQPEAPLTWPIVETWMAGQLAPAARQAVAEQNIADLQSGEKLPAEEWEQILSELLDEFGLALKIGRARWESAGAERAAAERERAARLARMEEDRQRERQSALQQEQDAAEFARQRAQIEANTRLSAAQREHELHVLELRRQREALEAAAQAEEARRLAEVAALEHEAKLAKLRRDLQAAQQAETEQQAAVERRRQAGEQIAAARAALDQIAASPEPVLAELHSRDASRAHQAAERLASPEFQLSPENVALLGFASPPQALVQSLRDKAAADRQPIDLRMTQLRTRDIGVAKALTLPVGASLQFEFSTTRPGHATLINIGTSGSVYIHAPSAYVPAGKTQIARGRYSVPGPELLPLDMLRRQGFDYAEGGPPGWEHLALIVSDEPAVDSAWIARARPDNPFIKLTSDELDVFCASLAERDAATWSAGVLSFLVE